MNTIKTLNQFCDDLTEHRRNVNIATVAGCSTSIVGGIMVGVGLLGTPLTLGAYVTGVSDYYDLIKNLQNQNFNIFLL